MDNKTTTITPMDGRSSSGGFTLRQLLRDIPTLQVRGSLDTAVHELRDDSRQVSPGDLFIALPGQQVDGHDFLAAAAARGAVGAVYQRPVPAVEQLALAVRVADVPRALASLAARRWGEPATRLPLVGVTGTNGKTTTSYLIEAMLRSAGRSVGALGTVNYRLSRPGAGVVQRWPAPWTTPSPLVLHQRLAELLQLGADAAVMEVSSHALALDRLWDVQFRVGAFSNLTQDHLDFHGTMERYFAAKALLFSDRLAPDGIAVAMVDGPDGGAMLQATAPGRRRIAAAVAAAKVRSIPCDGAVWAERYELRAEAPRAVGPGWDVGGGAPSAAIVATVATPRGPLELTSPLMGELNVANLLLAVAVGEALALPQEAMVRGLANSLGAPGRLEAVPNGRGPTVLVDYAHTPDALARVLAACRPLCHGRLFVVFGCGGDRDRTKRPQMGRIAYDLADVAVVTSDNPRTEDPRGIIEMILHGMAGTARRVELGEGLPRPTKGAPPGALVAVQPDRAAAIEWAIAQARLGDLILIAGKGHEDYQILGTTKHPFDDRLVASAALERLTRDGLESAP
jgi:UDP-N-acetylmuramoyl-L-alanyl-D-glutamate--2,6-diaminopimelate ligase